MQDRNQKKQIKKIAFLVACASVLQIAESLFPHPIPGIRLGLANIMTLVALVSVGFGAALEIAVFRTVISSFILGTFLSPSFFLSFSGALMSALVMGLVYQLSLANRKIYLSIVGISLAGSITHNLVQISLVYFVLIRHTGIFYLLPWLGISSVIMGWISGLVASQVCRRLEKPSSAGLLFYSPGEMSSSFKFVHFQESKSFLHFIRPDIKISGTIIIAITALFIQKPSIFAAILVILVGMGIFSKISFSALVFGLRKLSTFILFSFLIPLIFHPEGDTLIHAGPLKITESGLNLGILFTMRIVILIVNASLLIQTTSPDELTSGLKRLFYPLRWFGVSEERMAAIIMLAWNSIPELWEKIRYHIQHRKPEEKKLTQLIPFLSDIIARIYLQIEQED